jgi:hypothetical protein
MNTQMHSVVKTTSFLLLKRVIYRVSQEERSVFWEVTVSAILNKKVYIYICPIPNGFRDRATSLYSFFF